MPRPPAPGWSWLAQGVGPPTTRPPPLPATRRPRQPVRSLAARAATEPESNDSRPQRHFQWGVGGHVSLQRRGAAPPSSWRCLTSRTSPLPFTTLPLRLARGNIHRSGQGHSRRKSPSGHWTRSREDCGVHRPGGQQRLRGGTPRRAACRGRNRAHRRRHSIPAHPLPRPARHRIVHGAARTRSRTFWAP